MLLGFDVPSVDEVTSKDLVNHHAIAAAGINIVESLDLSGVVTRIQAETLLLGADEDEMTPVQTAPSGLGMTDLATLIPHSTLRVLEGCGHFISIEKGAETAGEILEFLHGSAGA